MDMPTNLLLSSTTIVYVAVKASLHSSTTSVFGLSKEEGSALTKRFNNFRQEIINGVSFQATPIQIINALAELGYKVVNATGESEIVWTMQREV